MKKNLYILLALASIAAASCKKGASDDGSDIDTSGFTVFDVNTEQIDIVEGQSFRDKWAEGTFLGLFSDNVLDDANAQYVLKRSGIGKSTARFYGPLLQGENVLAYTPYAADKALEDGKLPMFLAAEQKYSKTNTATAQFLQYCTETYAFSDDNNVLDFRYPYGVISFQLELDQPIQVDSMILSCDWGIANRLLLDEQEKLHPSSISSKSISLCFDTPVSSQEGTKYTSFFFIAPPGQYKSQTLTLYIKAGVESMSLKLNALEVERVKAEDFRITSIVIKSGDIPGFEKIDGFLE